MKFKTYYLLVDGLQNFTISDAEDIIHKGNPFFHHGKFFFRIHSEIIRQRFLWIACEYDDAKSYRDYVLNQNNGIEEPNPRTKNQIEPRQQFFTCYDVKTEYLYLSDINRRPFFKDYLSDILQKEITIGNVYTSVDEFCGKIKAIRGLKFTQLNNFYARSGDIFTPISDLFGLDIPEKIQVQIGYGDVPVHRKGRALLDRLNRQRDQFEKIIVVGCDDKDVEQTFDFSSVLEHIVVPVSKDENEHYNPEEVKIQLLNLLE